MYELKGKIALVTGGAAGIGLSCVKELLRHGVQAVTIADINETKGKEAAQEITEEFGTNRVIFVKTDVTQASQFEAAFKITVNTWKTIDIVMNNAGVFNDGQWELEIAINCNAVVQGTLLALQYMGKDKGGKGGVVVNTASTIGLSSMACSPIYVGTKHFVVGFGRSFGTPYHYDRTGVKILTLCPGLTHTALASEADKNALTTLSPDIGQQVIKDFGRVPGQPTESVGRGLIILITKGDNGSVWVCEGNEPIYEAKIPDRSTFRK